MKNVVVKRTRILGTNTFLYTAWEPSSLMGNHHSITHIDGKCYGQIGTTCICDEIKALPGGSQERIDACELHREKEKNRAYEAIFNEYPNLEGFKLGYAGEIEVTE